MKNTVKVILQKLLGFENYLYLFALYIIRTLKWNKNEGDFIFFRNMIPDEGLILDIGANIGVMSVHLARTHKKAEICAFEPIPYNINTLKKIISKYRVHNITITESALGDKTGTIEMVMPVQRSARLHGLSHVLHQSISENNTGEKFVTPVTTLDEFLSENFPDKAVTAIKIDVENYEYYVLTGATETIKKYKPFIYCELWENQNRQACFTLLTTLGYEIKILSEKKLCTYDGSVHKTQNFFFTPR
ncbi:MAG TPA: FkbM family methyltransferase [Bacteroidales bacterium]|nr:FkbM family methyltransferase [Bacteroidales bacterium]